MGNCVGCKSREREVGDHVDDGIWVRIHLRSRTNQQTDSSTRAKWAMSSSKAQGCGAIIGDITGWPESRFYPSPVKHSFFNSFNIQVLLYNIFH